MDQPDGVPLIEKDGSVSASVHQDMELEEQLRAEGAKLKAAARQNRAAPDKRWEMTQAEQAYFLKLPIDPLRSLSDDIIWVSNVIDLPEVPLASIPSVRARSILLWARENRNEFYKNTLPSAEQQRIKTLKDGGSEDRIQSDEYDRVAENELRDMLRVLVEEAQKIEYEPETGVVKYPDSVFGRRKS